MHLLTFRNVLLLCGFAIVLLQAISIPHAPRVNLAIPDADPSSHVFNTVFIEDRAPKSNPKSKTVKASMPKKATSKKAVSKKKKLVSKQKKKTSVGKQKKKTSAGKQKKKTSVGKQKKESASKQKKKKKKKKLAAKKKAKTTPKPTPAKWPTVKVSRPTTAVDICYLYVDCPRDGDDSSASRPKLPLRGSTGKKTSHKKANRPRNFVITQAPIPTPAPKIEARARRTMDFDIPDQGVITIISADYPSKGILYQGRNKPPVHVFDFGTKDMTDGSIRHDTKEPHSNPDSKWVTEHIIELQTLKLFLEDVIKDADHGKDLAEFLFNHWNSKLSKTDVDRRKFKPDIIPLKIKGQTSINDLVFHAFGSMTHRKDFVLCEKTINGDKARIWNRKAPTSPDVYEALVTASVVDGLPSNTYFSNLRTVVAVFNYMNEPIVKENMEKTLVNIEAELKNAGTLWKKPIGDELSSMWRPFMKEHLGLMEENVLEYFKDYLAETDKQIDEQVEKLKAGKAELMKREGKRTTNGDVDPTKKDYHETQLGIQASLQATIEKLEKEIKDQQTKIGKVIKELDVLEKKCDKKKIEFDDAETKLANLMTPPKTDTAQAKPTKKALRADKAKMRKEVKTLGDELKTLRDDLKPKVEDLYNEEKTENEMQQEMSKVTRKMQLLFSDSMQLVIDSLTKDKADIATLRKTSKTLKMPTIT
ncbi:hypothetical protein K504DRAFT_501096 [Pleomassaria siparia CBS 279.74]|uniref:Uncharacterized protein n=1 Tax=Pleomassaria siparia CBS 279.74 TaxID=1314801 RepID=A0A6G1KEG6_9PLEO|nr:hypothetical protein K504DRAFT_501096 [Pleomassaria siparia CBS 279.74]